MTLRNGRKKELMRNFSSTSGSLGDLSVKESTYKDPVIRESSVQIIRSKTEEQKDPLPNMTD